MFEFQNTRYEYKIRETPHNREILSTDFDAEFMRQGWTRVWADITLEGCFFVYRRERRTESST
jgi:hypothetical protein